MVLQVVGSLNSCELIYPIAEVDETLAMGYVDTRSDDMDKEPFWRTSVFS